MAVPLLFCEVFCQWSGRPGSIPDRVLPKIQKMILNVALLNIQHKVRMKSKVEQFSK